MNLQEILTQISLDVDQSTLALADTSAEYLRRVSLVNRYEKAWYFAQAGRWEALYKTLQLTILSGNNYVTLPVDFQPTAFIVNTNGYLLINNIFYKFISVDKLTKVQEDANVPYYCYIKGNAGAGYTLYINTAVTVDTTFTFNYYSKYLATDSTGADKASLTLASDISKVSEPLYLAYSVIADLLKAEDTRADLGQDFEARAGEMLANMIADNSGIATGTVTMRNMISNNGYSIRSND